MLEDVSIENYRCFARWRHSGFTRVNLIVGKNNSGKTALLEAIEGLVSVDSPFVFYRASIERGEVREHRSRPDGLAIDVGHWFHGHRLAVGATLRVESSNLDGAPSSLKRTVVDDPDRDLGLAMTLEPGDRRPARMPLALPISSDGFLGTGSREQVLSFGESLKRPVVFRTTRRLAVGDLSAAWTRVVLTPGEQDIVAALQVLEPRVTRVAITGSNGDATAQLLLQGEHQPVPLTSMGEGMNRMLSLALALVSAKGGYLFLDEIETGLHYSAHKRLWQLVLEMSSLLDVQVFATTHSKDCLEAIGALHRSSPHLTDALTVHRLEDGKSSAVRMTAEVVEGTMDAAVEVR